LRLPFSETEFLDVFAAYNTALWPAVVAFWIVTLGFSIALVRGRVHSLALTAFVAVHWAWEGIAYHAVFFSRINPAGWLFAVLFLVEAVAFLWLGIVRRRLSFDWGRKPRHLLAGLFIVYSLVYPLLAAIFGHQYPRAPAFAVPCPTALFTTAILLAAVPPVPRWLFVAPVVWSVIGGSAAVLLGMTPDLMLFAAAFVLLIHCVDPKKLERPRLGSRL
jgi:hypothetical protein